jgi:apolipoprotein N-acyltransferase
VLLAFSFPSFGHPALAWIALAPLLLALTEGSIRHAFALGLITGLLYFAGTLYWITRVMVVYGSLHPFVAVLVNGALVAFLALFPALFAVIVRRLYGAFGRRALLAAPLVWVATELGRTYLFSGFPWVLLGYSQVSMLPIAQLGSVLGVYGVSALLGLVSAAAVDVAIAPPGRGRYQTIGAALAAVVAVGVWGSSRMSRDELTSGGERVRIGLIQGNVDQAEKWNPARAATIFDSYLKMTRQAISEGARVVVWPESAIPFTFEDDRDRAEQVRLIARETQTTILLGSDEIERGAPVRYFNSAFVVSPDGSTAGVYRKIHLVPFGEYVPLKEVFFFASSLVEAVSDFSPGTEPVLLPVDGRSVSTAICYEIVYPALVRRFVREGSHLLTTITNDAWFGETSAPYQHFAQAAMRAIENGRYLVRSANTGISGVVDPYGRVLAASDLFEPDVIVREVQYLRALTIYTQIGDVFAYASVAVTIALLVGSRRKIRG